MAALSDMMHVLVDKLGEDTATLTMRFGLHSGECGHGMIALAGPSLQCITHPTRAKTGPVTAGVLRGDRARYVSDEDCHVRFCVPTHIFLFFLLCLGSNFLGIL